MPFGVDILAPLNPILAAASESAIDALLSASPDISEEDLRAKLKESKVGGKKYPVIRIKLTKNTGVKFWKFYENFFNESVTNITKKAGLNSNEYDVVDPRVKFSVSVQQQEGLESERGIMSKLGDRVSNVVSSTRYAYTNLYPPEFYNLNIITELQLDSASDFLDSASAESITSALIKIRGYLSQDKVLSKADSWEDFITISSQDMIIMAVLARHLYNILTKPVYICKDNAYSYKDSMYVPSIFFMVEDFTKFLMKINGMFRREFDEAITTKLAGMMAGSKTNKESGKTFKSYFQNFARRILGKKEKDVAIDTKHNLGKVVSQMTKVGYSDVLVDIVTHRVAPEDLGKETVESILSNREVATSFEEAMNIANQINFSTNARGESGGASAKKLRFGLTVESVMRDLIRAKDGMFKKVPLFALSNAIKKIDVRPLFPGTLALISSVVFAKDDDISRSEFYDTYLLEKLQQFKSSMDVSMDTFIVQMKNNNFFDTVNFDEEGDGDIQQRFSKIWHKHLSALKDTFIADILVSASNEQCERFEDRFPAEAAFINFLLRRRDLSQRNMHSAITHRSPLLLLVTAVTKKYGRYDFDCSKREQLFGEGDEFAKVQMERKIGGNPYSKLGEAKTHSNGALMASAAVTAALQSEEGSELDYRFNQAVDGQAMLENIRTMVDQDGALFQEGGEVEEGEEGEEGERSAAALRSELAKRMKNKVAFVTGRGFTELGEVRAENINRQAEKMVLAAIDEARADCYKGSVVPLLRMYSAILMSCFEQLVLLHASRSYLLNIIKVSGDLVISQKHREVLEYLSNMKKVVDEVRSSLYDLKKIAEYSNLRGASHRFVNIMSPFYDKIMNLLKIYLDFGRDLSYAEDAVKSANQVLEAGLERAIVNEVEWNLNAFTALSKACNMADDASKVVSPYQIVMSPQDVQSVEEEGDSLSAMSFNPEQRARLSHEIKQVTKKYYKDFYHCLKYAMQFIVSSGIMFLDYETGVGMITVDGVEITKKAVQIEEGTISTQVVQQLFSGYDEALTSLQGCFGVLLSSTGINDWGRQLLKDFPSPKYFLGLVPYKAIVEAAGGAKVVEAPFENERHACDVLKRLIATSRSSYLYLYMAGKLSGYRAFVRDSDGRLTPDFLALISECKSIFIQLTGLASLFGFASCRTDFDNIIKFSSILGVESVDDVDIDETAVIGHGADRERGFKAAYAVTLIQKMGAYDGREQLIGFLQQMRHRELREALAQVLPEVYAVKGVDIRTIEDMLGHEGLTDNKPGSSYKLGEKLPIYENIDHIRGDIRTLAQDPLVEKRPRFSLIPGDNREEVYRLFTKFSEKCQLLYSELHSKNKNYQAAMLTLFKTNGQKGQFGFNFWKKKLGSRGAFTPQDTINLEIAQQNALYSLYLPVHCNLSDREEQVLKKGKTHYLRKLTHDDDHQITLVL
ncbi:hypothetical protein PsalN5692_01879 [Piscirickettsia salmonis]|uniref:hypothetical protein n=1 Tax=Piscirickettsia salmonis TaxID=1238 RepID=UPI0018ACBF97|nr:hypothetical protein [Piscirickettsia salmonis]QGP50415.1 hypothetical protein PsalN5692_01879 [Piscirickettsia salmonis]